MFSVFESFFRASLRSSARKGAQEMRKSVFSHFADSCTIVARARAVRMSHGMSPGATPEAQGARRKWPGGGYTAWTERATKSPGWEKG